VDVLGRLDLGVVDRPEADAGQGEYDPVSASVAVRVRCCG
jgi:hypothetical protein